MKYSTLNQRQEKMHVCMCAQPPPTLCNPMDCSPPGPSVRGIL